MRRHREHVAPRQRQATKSSRKPGGEIVKERFERRARKVFGLLAILLVIPAASQASAPAGRATVMTACEELPQSVELRLVSDLPLSAEIQQRIRQEVENIWEPQGIAVEWAEEHTKRLDRVIYVVVRRGIAPGSGKTRVAGWIRFGTSGEPSNLIEASYETILYRVTRAKQTAGWRFAHSADGLHDVVIGRAIGRVVAHELGHWLLGPGHGTVGLMKHHFSGDDLIQPVGPTADVLHRRCRAIFASREETLE
jgi:hypothetical protein